MVLSPTSFRFAAPMDPQVAGGTPRRSGHPDWVLLHKSARISGHRNATTAECHTMEGEPIQVSFWLVDPPGVSYFSVNCPGLDDKVFADEPYIRYADATLVLFSVSFVPVPGRSFRDPGRRCTQRFVYRAGPGKPSLHLIPDLNIARPNGAYALLPCGDADSEHYAVVFLHSRYIAGDKDAYHDLHVFSSVTRAWSSKGTLPGLSEDDQKLLAEASHATYKVIKVGASLLGYVDLSWGILILCDVLSERPFLKYIPLPASRVCNMDEEGDPYIAPEYCCDVSSCNNLITFVDIEFDDRDRRSLGNQGWKATAWNRDISWDEWRMRSSVIDANILVDPNYSVLLPELWNDKSKELELKKLVFCTPTLSKDDDDFLYVMAKLNCEDEKAWVITVDMKHAYVEAIAPYSTNGRSLSVLHCPCTFSKYLELTPGDDVTMNFRRISVADCVLQLLLAQDWFMELDQYFKFGRPTNDECKSLLSRCPISSLLPDLQEVVNTYVTGHWEAAPKAVNVRSRSLENINVLMQKSLENFDVLMRKSLENFYELVNDPSLSTEVMTANLRMVLQGFDSFLRMVPPAVRVLADACHQKGDKAKFELCEKPGHHTSKDSRASKKEKKKKNKRAQREKAKLNEQEVVPDLGLPSVMMSHADACSRASKKEKKRAQREKAKLHEEEVVPELGLPSVMSFEDACRLKQNKEKLELCEKPGHHTSKSSRASKKEKKRAQCEKAKVHEEEVVPDLGLPSVMSFDDACRLKQNKEKLELCEKPGHHTSKDSRASKKEKKRAQRQKAEVHEQTVVPDHGLELVPDHGLERWGRPWCFLFFPCVLSATCILTAIVVST